MGNNIAIASTNMIEAPHRLKICEAIHSSRRPAALLLQGHHTTFL